MTSARKPSTKRVLPTLLALIAFFCLAFFSPDRAEASCGEKNCIGEDACKDSSSIGDNCPTGAGSFCVITCTGKASCSGNARFKPASESGHIICDGEDACKDAEIQLQGGAVASQWKLTCTGSNACGGNFDDDGVGDCSGGSCPTCSILSLQFPSEADAVMEEKHPDHHHPTETGIKVKEKNNDEKRGLMRFDLSSLPALAVLTQVHLSIDVTKKENNHTILIREVTQSWTETDVDWDHRSSGVSWTTPGGSYDASLIGSFSASSTGRRTISSSALTTLVSGWADGSIDNHGLVFFSDGTTNKEAKLGSRESGSDAPYLYVEYELGCAADEYVLSNTCSACPSGTTNVAGDDPDGGDTTCDDVDECATNNGSCGDPTYYSCTNNVAAAPTCADIDECATNNGGCGSATYYSCSNNAGADPTCGDIDECTANTDDCDANATCTNTDGSFTCECDAGFTGDGTTLLTGRETVTQSSASQWHSVSFSQPITSPVVKMFAEDIDGDPFSLRVRSITSSGFEFQIDEYDYLDGTAPAQGIAWIAVASGSQTLPNGLRVDAGFVNATDAALTAVSFTSSFSATPVAFSQVSSANSSAPIVSRNESVTSAGFSAGMQVEESDEPASVGTESIGWIAMGSGGSVATNVLVGNVTDVGDSSTTEVYAGGPFAATPIFIADMQTRNGGDPSVLVAQSVSASQAVIFVDEEISSDSETTHGALELVGYAVFAADFENVNDQTCADIDECATNNGDCGDPNYYTCSNNAGADPTCADIDECATNNGDCGSATYYTCSNNPGAEPTCADIDECATNNGDCGSATYYTCSNNPGADPT
jgi:hypothetical protein